MTRSGQQEPNGYPSHLIAVASQAYKLGKKLGRQREAASNIRKAFIQHYGQLRGECLYSIWLEWTDEM
jgi:hypothetical protein